MKDKMIRVKEEVIGNLKVLKGVNNGGTYSDIIHDLVHEKLLTIAAYTQDGFLLPGTVVKDLEGNMLIIESISDGKVVFNDQSYLFNGSSDCRELVKLSDTVKEYKGGRAKS